MLFIIEIHLLISFKNLKRLNRSIVWIHCGNTMDALWENNGYIVGKQWMHCGKTMDALWENNGCIVGKQWIHCGKTLVGEDTVIRNSVIGNGCRIGAHCEIDGAYIWDDTVVEAGCRIQKSVIASRCFIGEGSVILAGSILSFAVRIGPNARVPVGTRLVGQADQVALLDGFAEVSFFRLNFADSHREKCHGASGFFW